MAALQRIAKGFSGLLGLRAEGQNPTQVAEFLQPTIDTLAMYAAQKGMRIQSVSSGIGSIGATIEVPVPAQAIWLLHAAEVRVSYGAGNQNYTLSLRIGNTPFVADLSAQPFTVMTRDLGPSKNAAGVGYVTWQPNTPMILVGGQSVIGEFSDATGGFAGVTANCKVAFTVISTGPGESTLFR